LKNLKLERRIGKYYAEFICQDEKIVGREIENVETQTAPLLNMEHVLESNEMF
jgi:hypothetical protein